MSKLNIGSRRKKSRKLLVFILSTMAFALAYAAEEALSDDFLDYLTDYSDTQGEVLDPIDLMVVEAKQSEQEKSDSDAADKQEISN